ncbi:MAG TPA: AbgT family transporter [Wenzhouxiangellaceae bacterium]|nr:AbgT family transporter [Wenzhouxiangellaceae bacterium]
MSEQPIPEPTAGRRWLYRSLDVIERVGNRLPDPAVLFFLLMLVVWALSALLAPIEFSALHPQTGEPIQVVNQLAGDELARFLSQMVTVFTSFAPLGIVLVAMLGVGVAEHTGFINAALRKMLGVTSPRLLTPMLILVAIVSHTAADAGYVVVIPLGAVIFYAAGRHPLAGIAAAFAGVSGGFSANFIPSAIDPMLAGITEEAARVLDPSVAINPLVNWFFMAASSLLVIGIGWWLTDKIVEPRLARETPVDGDMSDMPKLEPLAANERRGLNWALGSIVLALVLLAIGVLLPDSPLRDPNPALAFHESITSFGAPLMRSIVPLIFILFLIPGAVYGYAAGTINGHRDLITGMSKSMESMGYYIVMAFFAAQFIAAFSSSNLGILIAVNGAAWLSEINMPAQMTIVGIIGLTAFVNLFVGSASAKWLIIAPIFVPMLMELGIGPGLTQAAYRVGDSSSNIVTPLLPYFPLIVVFCKRYFKGAGIGTLISMMLPYAVALAVAWTIFLLLYWTTGLPLGLQASYVYP